MANKYITANNLKIGQRILGTKDNTTTRGFTAYVKSIDSNFVTVSMWKEDGELEKIPSETLFSIKMDEREVRATYRAKAIEILNNITNKLLPDQIGTHEMWNGWLYGDIFEIAEACINEKMTIIGYCEDIVPKINTISGCEQNIGVCAEYDDGERIWCHYSGELLENLLDVNAELLKKQ